MRENAFFDVVSLPSVTPRILEALYPAAELSLAISLFEGGVSFVVSESRSVDTPVVVAELPLVRELLPDVLGAGLIDPHDDADIADSIQHAIESRSDVVSAQLGAYARSSIELGATQRKTTSHL